MLLLLSPLQALLLKSQLLVQPFLIPLPAVLRMMMMQDMVRWLPQMRERLHHPFHPDPLPLRRHGPLLQQVIHRLPLPLRRPSPQLLPLRRLRLRRSPTQRHHLQVNSVVVN